MPGDLMLEQELAQLDDEQRVWVEGQIAMRHRAATLATELALDVDDVFHILRNLSRSPAERLSLGLRHGRLFRAPQRR